MKPRCLTTIRLNMKATLLRQNSDYEPPEEIDVEDYGDWVKSQDPLTKEIIRVWVPRPDPNPDTPDVNENVTWGDINCMARGIVDGGIRVAGTTERFGDTYENIDYVKLWVPPSLVITKRDRVTNIRTANGHIAWIDEEFSDPANTDTPRATVFNVNGVTPIFDAWNMRVVEQFALLERASAYGPGD